MPFRLLQESGAHFGLTPKKYQSGDTDVTGRISKIGDAGGGGPSLGGFGRVRYRRNGPLACRAGTPAQGCTCLLCHIGQPTIDAFAQKRSGLGDRRPASIKQRGSL